MGNIFPIFRKNEFADLIRDFDHTEWDKAQPSSQDKSVHSKASAALERCPDILTAIENYKPCSDFIRKAMAEPTHENEFDAFDAVRQNAEIIYSFYRFAKDLEKVVPEMLVILAQSCEDGSQPFLEQQAIAKRLAEIFDFTLKFDELKMLRPGLQNDFSFYRRSLGKHAQDPDLLVKDDDASFISLFLAEHIPMMTALSKATSIKFQDDENITMGIANFANGCLMILRHRLFDQDSPSNKLCLRAMCGSIILYDHVEPEGAFHKRSPVLIRMICKMLTHEFLKLYPQVVINPNEVENMKNALRYSTVHFPDDSTPQHIVDALG